MESAPVIDNPGAKGLTNERFAAFVDNVDTRTRRKIHVALSFCYICRVDGSIPAAGPGPPLPSTISTKPHLGRQPKEIKNLVFLPPLIPKNLVSRSPTRRPNEAQAFYAACFTNLNI